MFTINPSISFFVNFDPSRMDGAREKIDEVWKKLEVGGTALMPIGEYPFSHRYGWIQDKYGVSWQLMLTNPDGEERPTIVPSFLFVGDVCGRAREAIEFYTDTFKESKKGTMVPYGKNPMNEREENLMFSDFKLYDMWFAAMDSGQDHKFAFNEAVSLIVNCDGQDEVDYYWEKLSAVPESEQCGWLKDRFGVSWQIIPTALGKLMGSGDEEASKRVTQAFLNIQRNFSQRLHGVGMDGHAVGFGRRSDHIHRL
jgi:predicted 3-demethylubiquinone-9 3-methyltransferase (glyoxalase superfamily)